MLRVGIFLSVILNTYLLWLYADQYHFIKQYDDFETVQEIVEAANERFNTSSESYEKQVLKALGNISRYEPLELPIRSFLDCSEDLISTFIGKTYSLRQQTTISNEQIEENINEYNILLDELDSIYHNFYTEQVLRNLKYKPDELKEISDRVEQEILIKISPEKKTINNLSSKEKVVFLENIQDRTRTINSALANIVLKYISLWNPSCGNGFFTHVFPNTSVVKLGEAFEAKITQCLSINPSRCNPISIYLDNKKVWPVTDYDSLCREIAKEEGVKKYEVVSWWIKDNGQFQSDTTYYQIYVNPKK